ncbi:MAG: hypothetical protein VKO21_07585 [Candidatus Sericytochromatia bacterium]|nr:hypothetical protein [Candidatus Sericytochromatia bacterium]
MSHHHVDVEEEPGTYRAVWGCAAALVAGVLGIILGGLEMKTYPGLAQATLALGALVVLLMAARIFASLDKWGSIGVIAIGVFTWYSPALFGVNPMVGDYVVMFDCWKHIGLGLLYVYLGTWGALGAPGKVEMEPWFHKTR